MLDTEVFEKIKISKSKILIVTKYWDKQKTQSILSQAQKIYPEIIYGLWENRIESVQEKSIPREITHFIGNIQSQKIRAIVESCITIHSLSSLKHARKIENIWLPISAFIQIQLDKQKNIWIQQDNLWNFIQECKDFKNLKIIGISGMWSADVSEWEKRAEFQKLISLRNKYIPTWIISAGTSRDYEIALEEWIDIVRVGSAITL